MELSDYIYRLKAESGDTTAHDELGVSGDLSGSLSLVSDGAGGYAWEITGAATLASTPSHTVVSTVDGGGAALVVRMQIVTAGTASDAPRARWDVGATPNYGLGMHRQSNTEVKAMWRTSASIYTLSTYYTPGSDYVTYVAQASCKAAASQDSVDLYYEGGTGSPDLQRTGLTYAGQTLNHLTIGFTGTVQRVSDVVLYPGELTPTQARALADDLRGALDGTSITNLAGAGTAEAAGSATIAAEVAVGASGAGVASGSASLSGGHDGVLGADIVAGSPLLNDDIDPEAYYTWAVVTTPSAGVLTIYTDGSFTYDADGVLDGVYAWTYELFEDGISVGISTVYITVGNSAIAAAGTAIADGAAAVSAGITLAGIDVAVAGGQAGASVAIPLSAAGIDVTAGEGGQHVTVTIAAAALAEAAGLATISGGSEGALSGAGGAVAGSAAVLAVTITLQATGSSESGGSAALVGSAGGALSAAGGAQADGAATFTVTVHVSAAGVAQAITVGSFVAEIDLRADGYSSSTGLGVAAIAVASQPPVQSYMTLGMRLARQLNGEPERIRVGLARARAAGIL